MSPTKDPSTRQGLVKMGNFFEKMRQKAVREASEKRQRDAWCGGWLNFRDSWT